MRKIVVCMLEVSERLKDVFDLDVCKLGDKATVTADKTFQIIINHNVSDPGIFGISAEQERGLHELEIFRMQLSRTVKFDRAKHEVNHLA